MIVIARRHENEAERSRMYQRRPHHHAPELTPRRRLLSILARQKSLLLVFARVRLAARKRRCYSGSVTMPSFVAPAARAAASAFTTEP